MKQKIKCKAVFFDLWDTLIVSHGVMRQTQDIMGLEKMPFHDFVSRFEPATMTKKFALLGAFFAAAFNAFGLVPEKKKILALVALWRSNLKNAALFPETISVLQELKARNFKLVLISNCLSFGTNALLKRLRLQTFFDSIQFSFEAHLLKPDKRLFQRALKELKLQPHNCIMVGDSSTDVLGAKNAHIKAILVDRKKRKSIPTAGIVVSDLCELLKIVKN